MAKKRRTGPNRKITPQTRVKLSQASRKRRRAPKGSPYAGRFLSGLSLSGARHHAAKEPPYNKKDVRPPGRTGKGGATRTTSPKAVEEIAQSTRADAERTVRQNPRAAAEELAFYKTESIAGARPSRAQMGVAPTRVTEADMKLIRDMEKEQNWRAAGTYRSAARKPVSRFLKEDVAPSHRKVLDEMIGDPNSEFNRGLVDAGAPIGRFASPAQRNRVRLYTELLQEGMSHDEALGHLRQERRGRVAGVAAPAEQMRRERGEAATAHIRDRSAKGRTSKTQSVAPRPGEFSVGVAIPAIDTMDKLKKQFPNATERELFRIQETQRETFFDEFHRNQLWTHETKKARVQGASKEEGPDRVVFFTTSLGHPAPSVPSDSLLGQYVIRKRKKMLKDANVARGKELRGKFPEAVRDVHIVEAATGVSLGAQGRAGINQQTGVRWGARRKIGNLGKPVPFGSHIMYDSQGRPMYDSEGNIRFTEGASRPFDYQKGDLGLRIFIG